MHLLVTAHDYYPDPGSGGTGRYVAETASRLSARGHDVSVVTRRRGDVPVSETRDGVDVYRYDIEIAGRTGFAILAQLPRAIASVADHVRTARATAGSIDAVSFQGPVTSALVAPVVGDHANRFVTLHSPWPIEYRLKTRDRDGAAPLRARANVALRRYVERQVLNSADHLVTLSEFMREQAGRVYDHSLPVSVVPGGVDTTEFTPRGPTVSRIEGTPAFLTVRRLSERMGHELLLDAFATVVDHYPAARLYVAGDGPLRSRLERTADRLGIGRETAFLGHVPDADLPATYRSADVFVLPTTDLEGFGLATLEALASGLPVVATPVGGTVELLDPLASVPVVPGSVLVEAAEPEAVADGMMSWATLPAGEYTDAARTCRRYAVHNYPWRRTVSRLEELYGRPRAGEKQSTTGR